MIIPGHERTCYAIIGRKMGEDPNVNPAISAYEDGLSVGITACNPGKGPGLHYHPRIEVFGCLSGTFSVYWGDEGEHEVILNPFDAISVPAGVMRGFRNVGRQDGMIMGLHPGGPESMNVTWSPKILEEASRLGWILDKSGKLVIKARPAMANSRAKKAKSA
jgi:mannose-6-phosphate isomerase-like protein (cupin superfamily)